MSQVNQLEALRFPLFGSRLIEASAGTGKTYTIAALYVRLVLGHGHQQQQQNAFARPLSPEEILVVTFTEAATEELRDRIRARLLEAAQLFREELQTDDQFLTGLLADYTDKASWPSLARRLELAASGMDEAAVHTIHGWCNRMLREHAFASGSLFHQQLNTDAKPLWLAAARDYWRTFLQPLTNDQQDAYTALIDEWKSPEALFQKLRGLLGLPQPQSAAVMNERFNAALTDYQQQCQQIRAWRDQQPWQAWLPEATELLEQAVNAKALNGNTHRATSVANWISELTHWVNAAPNNALYPVFSGSNAATKLTTSGLTAAAKKGQTPLQHPLFEALEQLHDRVCKTGLQTDLVQAHALAWLPKRFSQLQEQRAEMGFDDMLVRLQNALNGPHAKRLAQTIREQFPVAMIDEFQDTDPVQYSIFNSVYRLAENDSATGIFLIGDPKQAIYSFRQADIFTYLQARRDTASRHYTLAKNFRSTKAMVAATNRLFEIAEQSPRGAFRFKVEDDNEVPFIGVDAHGRKQTFVHQQQSVKAMQWFEVPAGGKANNEELNRRLAEHTAETIAQLLTDPTSGFRTEQGESGDELVPVQPKDIAVLVNSGGEAEFIRKALQQRSVRSVYMSDRRSVFSSQMAQDLRRLLSALALPTHPSLVREALATPLLGRSLSELEQIRSDEATWEGYAEQFIQLHSLWQRRGVLAMLQNFIHHFSIPARLMNEPDGERALTDLLHVAELLQHHEATNEGLSSTVSYLAEAIEAANDDDKTDADSQQLRLESDQNLVQIVTVHKSKGLQYPIVFLPFANSIKKLDSRIKPPFVYHDSDTREIKIAYSKSDEAAVKKADEERLAEDVRKLYVAVTRAQYATYLGVAPFGDSEATALHHLMNSATADEAPNLRAFADALEHAHTFVADASNLTKYQPQLPDQSNKKFCQMPDGYAFERWWVASYSALSFSSVSSTDDPNAANTVEALHTDNTLPEETQTLPMPNTIHDFPRGAQPGTYLHNLLEEAAAIGFASLADDALALEQFVASHTTIEPWINHRETLNSWLQQYLQTPFRLGAQSEVALSQLQTYRAEPEFWFAAHQVDAEQLDQLLQTYIEPKQPRPQLNPRQMNGMLKGFIDLVFEWQGKFYVADYKSNYLGPNDQAYTQAAMRDKILASRYDLQYVLYTLALHKLLKARMGASYDYDQHVGGAVYLFMRGVEADTAGAFFDRPPRPLIEQLEQLFMGQAHEHA